MSIINIASEHSIKSVSITETFVSTKELRLVAGHGDEEHGTGNAVSSNVMAGRRARGEKEQLRGSFYKL